MVTLNQAERLRRKSREREVSLKGYRYFYGKLKEEQGKDAELPEELLDLLAHSRMKIKNGEEFRAMVSVLKESEKRYPNYKEIFRHLSGMEMRDVWKNFLEALELAGLEISPSEMLHLPSYPYDIFCISPKGVEGLKKIRRVDREMVKRFDLRNLAEIREYEPASELGEREIKRLVETSRNLASILKNYNLKAAPEEILKEFLRLCEQPSEEMLRMVERLPAVFGNEKIRKRIKAGEKFAGTEFSFSDLLYIYSTNPGFLEAMREGKIDVEELFEPPPQRIGENPSLYGRIRVGRTRNVVDLAAYGREGREPYHDSEYLLYFLSENRNSEKISEIEKKIRSIEKYSFLREKLSSLRKELRRWREEGKNYEGINIRTGAYAKWNGDVNLEEAYNHRFEGDAVGLRISLNKGLKSPSHLGKIVNEFISELYLLSKQAEKDPGTAYVLNHWKELSEQEREFFRGKTGMEMLERVERAIKSIPKGVYSEAPPLHSGNRGEDVEKINPRSCHMLDKVFYNYRGERVAVTEYLMENPAENEEMRIRIYDFNGKGEFAIEVQKNGRGRFLSKREAEEMGRKLKEYTVPTLFLKGYFEKFFSAPQK